MIEETIKLSFKSILTNRLRAFLTILGIVIGVTSVILLISLVTGLKNYITNQISGLGANLIYVIPGTIGGGRGPGGVVVNKLIPEDADNLQIALHGIAVVSPVVQQVGTITLGNKTSDGASITGANATFPKVVSAVKLAEGRWIDQSEADSGKRVAVIAPTVRTRLFGDRDPIGKTIEVNNSNYRVIGLLQPRGSTFGIDEDNAVAIPLEAAQTQFGITNLNTIYIAADSANLVNTVKEKTTKTLLKRLSSDDFTVQDQEQTLSTVSQITGVLTLALGGIAAISLIVGGIGVMNIMLVSVTERTREIGLRKALGAQPEDIRNQFLIEAMTLSGIGGIIGIILGYLLSLVATIFIQTTVPLWSVILSFGFSMVVGVIFGVAPAIRAARLNPIQALRYE